MGSMTDERRKEMEEEMMRFEQEIFSSPDDEIAIRRAGKSALLSSKHDIALESEDSENSRELDMDRGVIPAVLAQPPPPPPSFEESSCKEQSRPPQRGLLPPPPMPPGTHMHFIPHQLQRGPPRPPPRPSMGPPRPPPGGFQGPGPMMPFPPMQGPPMPMPPMRMPMPMPHGFCPPPPPPPGMAMPSMPRSFMPPPPMRMPLREPTQQPSHSTGSTISSGPKITKTQSTISSAPTIYAAPPMKTQNLIKTQDSSVPINGEKTSSIEKTPSSQPPSEAKTTKPLVESTVITTVSVVTTTSSSSTAAASATTTAASHAEPVVSKKKEKKKKIVRMGGGQAWEDNSLLDWESDDFRIFCGDLGNDVTDEVLIRAFSKYPSFGKAKVIRDKRTNKTKGYGFVSFKDPQDFIRAMREMNGRYVGSRPIKLRKSTWKDRNIDIVRKKQKEKEKLGLL